MLVPGIRVTAEKHILNCPCLSAVHTPSRSRATCTCTADITTACEEHVPTRPCVPPDASKSPLFTWAPASIFLPLRYLVFTSRSLFVNPPGLGLFFNSKLIFHLMLLKLFPSLLNVSFVFQVNFWLSHLILVSTLSLEPLTSLSK